MKNLLASILALVGLGSVKPETVSLPLTSLTNLKGHHSTDQDLSVLDVTEQSGSQNDWDTYIEFFGGSNGYMGIFDYTLPSDVKVADISSIQLEVNYLGTNVGWAEWKWQIYNFDMEEWVFVGNNVGAGWSSWKKFEFEITEATESYVGNGGLIKVRFMTLKQGEVCDLDVQRVIVDVVSPPAGEIWQPTPGTSWQWQISGTVDTSKEVDMYDIDLFDTPQWTIDQLHAAGRKVICYFSAGSFEDWRPDADEFSSGLVGSPLGDWEGEWWLDIRKISTGLGPIMEARMDLAVSKNCDGVEPDNIDAYQNDNGLGLTSSDQLVYNKWLADQAHARGLSIGLKNDLDQVLDLVDHYDWALNEQCWEYDECDLLLPFVDAGKAVFGVEYTGSSRSFCPPLNQMGFSWLKKTYDLDAWVQDCRNY